MQLFIGTPIPNSISINYGTQSSSLSIPSTISSQPVLSSSCGSHIIWNTAITFSGPASTISVSTSNVYFN